MNSSGVTDCLTLEQRPPTPVDIKKFRKQVDPGRGVVHPGKANDQLPTSPEFAFGKKISSGERAADVLQPRVSRLVIEDIEKKEQVYNRAPIGQVKKNPHIQVPEDIAFGMPTKTTEGVKDALTITIPETVDPQFQQKQKKIHKNYEPGEQMKREYEWDKTSVNPNEFSFGTTTTKDKIPVSEILRWQEPETSPPSRLPKASQDVPSKLPPNYTFGVPTRSSDSAGETLANWSTLGNNTTRENSRPVSSKPRNLEEEARKELIWNAYTTPKIRSPGSPDRTKISKQSKAAGTHSAYSLMTSSGGRGALEEQWQKERSPEDLLSLAQSSGMEVTPQEHETALNLMGKQSKPLTVENYMNAVGLARIGFQ